MNEHIASASALTFVRSLRKAYLGAWKNASLALPTVGLSQLYVDNAQHFITLHGGKILCGADVVRVLIDRELVTGLRLRNNLDVECSALILAVPSDRLVALCPDVLVQHPSFSWMQSTPPSPIVSVHLWFADDAMDDDMVGVIGRRIQWLFNKRRILKERGTGGHISAVISAAYDYVSRSNDELVLMAVEDLRSVYPMFEQTPTRAVVIREKRATFSSTPMVERLRPDQRTPVPNLFLAGDWTNTGYPATIEGAVISAERCAEFASRWLREHVPYAPIASHSQNPDIFVEP
jgi:protoporphyrinogen oxidase